jgi:hypothetical protein
MQEFGPIPRGVGLFLMISSGREPKRNPGVHGV